VKKQLADVIFDLRHSK